MTPSDRVQHHKSCSLISIPFAIALAFTVFYSLLHCNLYRHHSQELRIGFVPKNEGGVNQTQRCAVLVGPFEAVFAVQILNIVVA